MNLKGLNALVTGSEGFVGRRLVHALHNQGVSVIPLDVKNGVDLTDGKHLNEYLKKTSSIDIVFHLAAIVFVPYSFEHPQITYITNVVGTLNMLELARLRGVKKFVFASSYVYGPPHYLPIDEQHPLHAVSPYNRSKILAEELCHGYYEDYGVSCAILRPFNIYGQGQSKQFLIPQIINQLPSRTIVLQNPTPKRDYVYVDDVVSAYMKAAMYNGTGYDVFNIGSGRSYSVQEVVDKILTLSQRREVTVTYTHKKREHEIIDIVADIKKAKENMKWQPTIDIDKGLLFTLKEAGT